MRTEKKERVTLKYPDEIGFAFNPCLLVATGEAIEGMTVNIRNGEQREFANYEAFRGACYADLRELVQGFFDTQAFEAVDYGKEQKTKLGVLLSFEVAVYDRNIGDNEFRFDVFYIWGALRTGGRETYNRYRTLTWFRGYPFVFGIYASGGGSVLLNRDGVPNRFISISEQGVWNVPLLPSDIAKEYYTISDSTGAFTEAVFDATFDMTFKYQGGVETTERLRINVVDDCDGGYYLRWIDRHGFYCHYLFKAGEEQRKVTSDGVFLRNNLLAYDMTYGYQGVAGYRQAKQRDDIIEVGAPLVDSETWDMLFDITTSPCVDMFAGYDDEGAPKWVSIGIAAGTYAKKRASLQDFVCNIILPETDVQKL